MTVTQADSTVVAIRAKVRHLTNSPGINSLTDAKIDQTLNDIYNTDFAYGIKVDQMRDVYEIYTEPYIDRYPLDVNYNQGVRGPAYFDGTQGSLFKDRRQFFNLWPNVLTEFTPASGDGNTQSFPFTIQGPFVSKEVIIGSVDTAGNAISITDDGNGNLYYLRPNPQTSVPAFNTNPAKAGMYNQNTGNPGLYNMANNVVNPAVAMGTVNYVTGAFTLDFTVPNVIPAAEQPITVRVSQYQTGKPYNILFWNNEFTIRPIPDKIHKITVEVYLTPIQFMLTTDNPILNQWAKYLAYLTAAEIQRERNDFDGVRELQEGAKRQEALVLERQGIEEIGQMTPTLFNSTSTNQQVNSFLGGWF